MLRQARDPRARKQWLNDACKSLKHDQKGPQVLIEQMQGFIAQQKLAGPQNKIKAALTYFHASASLRTLSHSCGHWEQFWNKIDQYGFPVVA